MEFILPQSEGWSARHLVNAEWGHVAVIVKRDYMLSGDVAEPVSASGLVVADIIESGAEDGDEFVVIRQEAETALLKSGADVLFLGRGTEANDSHGTRIDSANLSVGGVTRRSYARPGMTVGDPVNLFGYEPRQNRIAGGYDPDTFDFATDGAALFKSARRALGFTVPNAAFLGAGSKSVEVTTTSADGTDTLADFTVTLPVIEAVPFVWEGGRNDPAYWCRRDPAVLNADTMTINGTSVSVIWRGKLPLAEYPIADIRRIDIKEAA